MLRWILIAAAIFFIFIFAMIWLGIIAGLAFSMPILTTFFPSQELLTMLGMINVLFTVGIPILAIILGIVRVVFGRRMGRAWVVVMIVFWVVNVFSLASIGSTLGQEFMVEEQMEESLPVDAFLAETVTLSYYDMSDENDRRFYIGGERIELPGARARYTIKKSPDGEWHVNKLVTARGRKGADARALAADLHFPLQTSAGELAIPREVPFSELAKWRDQEVELEVLVPEGALVKLTPRVVDRGMMRVNQFPDGAQVYQMASSGQLVCQTCAVIDENSIDDATEEAPAEQQNLGQYQDFNSVILEGSMKVTIEQGDTYDLELAGPGQYLSKVESSQADGTLTIRQALSELSAPVRVYITLPDLQELVLDHTDDVLVKGFKGEPLSINASGDFEVKARVDVKELNISATEGVEVEFTGSTELLNASLENECRLDTDRGTVLRARINAQEGSRIKLKQGVEIIEQDVSSDSSVRFVN